MSLVPGRVTAHLFAIQYCENRSNRIVTKITSFLKKTLNIKMREQSKGSDKPNNNNLISVWCGFKRYGRYNKIGSTDCSSMYQLNVFFLFPFLLCVLFGFVSNSIDWMPKKSEEKMVFFHNSYHRALVGLSTIHLNSYLFSFFVLQQWVFSASCEKNVLISYPIQIWDTNVSKMPKKKELGRWTKPQFKHCVL